MKFLSTFTLTLMMLTSVFSNDIPVKCWVINDDSGTGRWSAETVSNIINRVNCIYMQVCIRFSITDISSTNSTYLSSIDISDSIQWTTLCDIERNSGCLELYFVRSIIGGATAFKTNGGIVIGPGANEKTVAHEIGHACGLPDIYTTHQDTVLTVRGNPSKERMPDDWGWYPRSVTQEILVKRLLMYGVYSTNKVDISYGDVYGVHYTNSFNRESGQWNKVWFLDNAPVGFGRHGNRNPVSQ